VIDQSQIKGEKFTGYEGPAKGPFACSNCSYFEAGSCGQKTMMEKSNQPRADDGRVKVDPKGCCEFISRVGKKSDPNRPGRRITAGKREQ
jgi:hypothetical protein